MKTWQCTVCKYIHKGDAPPEKCPICGVPASKFIEIDPAEAEALAAKKKRPPAKKAASPDDQAKTETAEPAAPEPTPPKKDRKPYDILTDLMVQHHAHPVSVHFPNGVLPVAVMVFVLAWLFDSTLLSQVGMVNLIFVLLVLPFVLYSGVIEWQKKYMQAMTVIFKIKILAAAITTASCVISLAWVLIEPDVLTRPHAWAFILINVVMIAAAGVAGHIGGKLVFKD